LIVDIEEQILYNGENSETELANMTNNQEHIMVTLSIREQVADNRNNKAAKSSDIAEKGNLILAELLTDQRFSHSIEGIITSRLLEKRLSHQQKSYSDCVTKPIFS